MTTIPNEQELILRGHVAFKRYREATEEKVEATLALAAWLWEARQQHPSDIAFGHWLLANNLDELGKNDRAALVNIAQHPDLYRDIKADSRRSSLELIWREIMQPRLAGAAQSSSFPSPRIAGHPLAEEVESASGGRESPHEAPAEDAISESIEIEELPVKVVVPTERPTARSPLKNLLKADLVLGHVQHATTRTYLAALTKARPGPIWSLMVEAIETEAFGPPASAVVKIPSLRLLLPWAPSGYSQRFDLRKPRDRALIREDIFPTVLQHRERLQREPEALPMLVNERYAARQAARTPPAPAVALPATERQIVAFGQTLWPRPNDYDRWTYQDVCEAAWFFDFAHRQYLAHDMTPRACALQTRQLLKWISPAAGTQWARVVEEICLRYSQRPEGLWDVPPPPVNYKLS